MGSVTVTGTSTMSTFMRMREPGWIFSASGPLAAGASAPLGSAVDGVAVVGAGT